MIVAANISTFFDIYKFFGKKMKFDFELPNYIYAERLSKLCLRCTVAALQLV